MYQDAFEVAEVGPFAVKLYPDDDPMDPREWCNVGVMLTWHPDYKLGDVQVRGPRVAEECVEEYGSPEAWLEAEYGAIPETILPLYLLDHSGLRMSTGSFGDPWDSGQVGFTFATAATLKETGCDLEHVAEALRIEVRTYDLWLAGGFCGFVVEGPGGDVLDSCGGFDDPEYAMSEGRAMLECTPEYRRFVTVSAAELEGIGL